MFVLRCISRLRSTKTEIYEHKDKIYISNYCILLTYQTILYQTNLFFKLLYLKTMTMKWRCRISQSQSSDFQLYMTCKMMNYENSSLKKIKINFPTKVPCPRSGVPCHRGEMLCVFLEVGVLFVSLAKKRSTIISLARDVLASGKCMCCELKSLFPDFLMWTKEKYSLSQLIKIH